MGCTNTKNIKEEFKDEEDGKNDREIERDGEGEEEYNSLPNVPILDISNYLLCSYISEGAIGQVYTAYNKQTSTKIAMKLFGYTDKQINIKDIYREISLFSIVTGIPGLVEFYGIFQDTEEGIAPNKVEKISYPVICMELLEGGDMFDRIQERKSVSEKFIATVFYDIVTALDGLHKRGYLHRDLKLENIMLTNNEENAKAKIIDFGNVVRISIDGTYISEHVNGTIGYVAPESFLRKEYSPKTDIWQAGVVLYSLLSGYQPFNPYKIEQCIEARYMSMTGDGWDNISDDAKDLISKILKKNPTDRLTATEILSHHWVTGSASEKEMSNEYYHRIKHLALRQRMKKFFLDRNIAAGNKERKAKLQKALPFVRASNSPITVKRSLSGTNIQQKPRSYSVSRSITLSDVKMRRPSSSSGSPNSKGRDVKLNNLRTAFLAAATHPTTPKRKESEDTTHILEDFSNSHETTPNDPYNGEIDFSTFVSVLMECGLPELATHHVFNIFGKTFSSTIYNSNYYLISLSLSNS